MKNLRQLLPLIAVIFLIACSQTPPPAAHGPLPAPRQLAWHETEFYAFVHFNMNTFTDMEWGLGGESPELFNPTELDCRQWAKVCKDAGMKGIIITAKHHDGFCLWPSEYTEHSVKNSPWKDGKGDVIRELSEACKEYGLKMGIYLSPWDRNHAQYGTLEYITYFRNQLRELLTNYGDVFEVWFDGANGGDGYYGGANETRKVDRKNYYDWDNTHKIIREFQPNAVIFSDAGPGVRWVGNEEGWANPTNWSTIRRDEFYPGSPNYKDLRSGHQDGTHWVPAECDVSIRPGWYYHEYEDHKVKSLAHLRDIYYKSIGRNASFLLNFPVDRRGLIHENDVEQLQKLAATIKEDFADDLAQQVEISATNVRGNNKEFDGSKTIDNNPETYWATDDGVISASMTLDFGKETAFNRFLAQEYIPLGQRVKKFTLEALINDNWEEIASETTIGNKRILRLPDTKATKLRLNIVDAKACPTISNIGVYYAPRLVVPPVIARNKSGEVTISAPDEGTQIFYTIDGSEATNQSTLYQGGIEALAPTQIKAISYDPDRQKTSETALVSFDVSKTKWSVVKVSSGDLSKAVAAIDDDPQTFWETDESQKLPQEIVIDLGESLLLRGLTYLPTQKRWQSGIITNYEVYISEDGRNWGGSVSTGEFSNIWNNPIEQRITFNEKNGRYIKLNALKSADDQETASFGEVGVITR